MGHGLLLGIDIGTSGAKAGLFEPEGRVVRLGRSAYRTESPRPGWAETPPERWWRAVAAAVRAVGPRARDAQAVGLSVLFPALVAMDGRGRALRPAILYCDQRSAEVVQALGERPSFAEATEGRRERIERLTGNRLAPGTCSLSSLLWLKEHEPETYGRAALFGHAGTYLALRLTGERAMDRTNASLSGLVELGREEGFSPQICELAGVDGARWPPVLRSAEVVGKVTAAAARATGLRRGTPVVIGAGDAVAGAFGAGLLEPGRAFCVLGSSDNVATARRRPRADPQACNMAHCVDGRWLSIATATSAGAAVEWFARAFLPACPAGAVGRGAGASAAQVERLARRSPAGARGVVFLPYLRGERTPVWDAGARGAFFGLTASTRLEDMARAVLEGTAFAFRQVLETRPACPAGAVGRGEVADTTLRRLRSTRLAAVGGGSRSRLGMEIRASVIGRQVRVMRLEEPSALGAAMLAGMGTGQYRSAREAVAATEGLRATDVVRPRKEWAETYERGFRLYAELYPRLRGLGGS